MSRYPRTAFRFADLIPRSVMWVNSACLLFALAGSVFGHGDLHDNIEHISAAIAQDPGDTAKYERRGLFYLMHKDWDLALADFDVVAQRTPDADHVDVLKAKALLGAHRYEPAVGTLDRVLADRPDHAQAHLLRARALLGLGKNLAAADAYSQALNGMPHPSPDHYVERARAVARAGADRFDDALAGLDEGIARLGPLVSLQSEAIRLDLRRGAFDAALVRIESVLATPVAREKWLVYKGDVLRQAGRRAEANACYREALESLRALPEHRRRTRQFRELEDDAVLGLAGGGKNRDE